jgi:hypothetical protein
MPRQRHLRCPFSPPRLAIDTKKKKVAKKIISIINKQKEEENDYEFQSSKTSGKP